jgi:hypothetical protein
MYLHTFMEKKPNSKQLLKIYYLFYITLELQSLILHTIGKLWV